MEGTGARCMKVEIGEARYRNSPSDKQLNLVSTQDLGEGRMGQMGIRGDERNGKVERKSVGMVGKFPTKAWRSTDTTGN